MARPRKIVDPDKPLTPIQEIDRKIQYHESCIAKLKARKAKLNQPNRKQITALLSKVEGMTMEEIADKLGVKL